MRLVVDVKELPYPHNYDRNVGHEYYFTTLNSIGITNCDWELHLRQDPGRGRYFIQFQFDAQDNTDPTKVERQYCRKWYLSPHMTKTEIVRTVWKAYEAALLHEAQESFVYKGVAIFNPHRDVESLVDIGSKSDIRE